MKSLVSSMTILPKALIAAIVKSVVRCKSLIGLLFSFWTSTRPLAPPPSLSASATATLPGRSVDDFLAEAEELILGPYADRDDLLRVSAGLEAQYREALAANQWNMLPSYNHRVPSGREKGRFLAIDVGGTTLRIALVELRGRDAPDGTGACEILRTSTVRAEEGKALVGMAFFEWMADRIVETVSVDGERWDGRQDEALPMAVTWSFPIECVPAVSSSARILKPLTRLSSQKSIGTGLIYPMGKGFRAADGLLGEDLGSVISRACRSRGLEVRLQAILNDGTACLLSQSYVDPSTRFGLILGTGSNAAAFLPVSSMDRAKFGDRPASWFDSARQVVVNTEVSMYGRDVLSLTRWDKELKRAHEKPWFQPLEHMCSGMYLGECCRLPLVEAISRTGIFGGVVPESLRKAYSLQTETLSLVES